MDAYGFLADLRAYYIAWGIVFLLLTSLELVNPRESHSLRSRLWGIAFWAISIAFSLAFSKLMRAAWNSLGLEPLLAVPSVESLLPYPLLAACIAGLVSATVHDFAFYWYHRAQHRWLWRWHAVHHSVRQLNAVNSYHHISETLFSAIIVQVPLTLLLDDVGATAPIVTLVLWCHIVWIHSPTKLTLGPLRVIFVDNRFHRIHHSLAEEHFDKNFGAFTTLWDRWFGTCHMPAKDEWPAVGIAGTAEPAGLGDWLEIPVRLGRVPEGRSSDLAQLREDTA